MKNRPARVRELILRELGALIAREFTFAAKLVTVQAVDLTADFKHCHVHVGVLGTPEEQKKALGKLQEHRPHLQHELAKRVILKYTPQLHFHLDEAIERGTKVMEILRQIDEITPAEAAAQDVPVPAETARAAQSARDMAAEDERLAQELPLAGTAPSDGDEDDLTEESAIEPPFGRTRETKAPRGARKPAAREDDALIDE